jgi:general secretion pathway protein A
MKSRRLRWALALLFAFTGMGWSGDDPAAAKDRPSESGAALQQILELENTARLLAILLDSGRSVVNENLPQFDDPQQAGKLTAVTFDRQLADIFLSRSGTDLRDLDQAKIPARSKRLLKELVAVSKEIVAEAQQEMGRPPFGWKGFIPAVFGARAAARFSERTGVRLKQTALAPRNPTNAPDSAEKLALETFADSNYPREKVISEVTAKSRSLRLMYPLYTTRHCLDCHGEPKGERDKMGYAREGLKLGQNAGAISVIIPLRP